MRFSTRADLDETVLTIPAVIVDLDTFRRWTFSDNFPERGRIDYIAGQIEVDMSPSNIQRHSAPKTDVGSFKAATRGRDGYLKSAVLGISLKLTCEKGLAGPTLVYDVLTK